jgi:hypothetical protein
MDEEVPLPVEPYKGYPAKYLLALEPHDIDGCRCDTFGFWRKHLRNVSEVGGCRRAAGGGRGGGGACTRLVPAGLRIHPATRRWS